MRKNIYIIGHKLPDLDSVIAAICYSEYKNKLNLEDNYLPAIAGNLNKETEYILKKFNYSMPEKLENAENKNIILVDHNELIQSINGMDKANICEVLDHHKVNFEYSEPIEFCVKAWGATCTIIADLFFQNNLELNVQQASVLLSAILVDTVITKSPTCTQKDIKIIEKLAKIARIDDWREFGMEIFKVRSEVSELSDLEIIKSDFKEFILKSGKFGIGQVETVDLTDFENRKDSLLNELEKQKKEGNYHSIILFITDIIKEGSLFLISSNEMEKIAKAFQIKINNLQKVDIFIPGIISRKKQVAPELNKVFN